MKPIEIHIEGYKIVISEDDGKGKPEPSSKGDVIERDYAKADSLIITTNPPISVPSPYAPTVSPMKDGWWERPSITWTKDDSLSNYNSTTADFHPVRDAMVNGGAVASSGTYTIGEQSCCVNGYCHINNDSQPKEENAVEKLKNAIKDELDHIQRDS